MMKKTIACAAFVAALLSLGSTAFAADTMMKGDAMAKPDTTMATMLCRPAATGEKMTAMTADKAPLVCKPMNHDSMMTMKKNIEAMPGGEPLWLKMFQEYHIGANGVG